MSNNYFRFKKFTVYQDMCSMKVCTDACLFGAWVADKIERGLLSPAKILDIGTGTGLLSLMAAQKSNTTIDAVELDENAFEQAKKNFNNSPWAERLNIIKGDIKDLDIHGKYDLIISNPPFFENELKSPNKGINLARHDSGLDMEELLNVVHTYLNSDGVFAVLLPYQRVTYFEQMAGKREFYVSNKMIVCQIPNHSPFRVLFLLTRIKTPIDAKEITIKNAEGGYTDEFRILLKDYYLNL